jgi:hypothetical protein
VPIFAIGSSGEALDFLACCYSVRGEAVRDSLSFKPRRTGARAGG